MVYTLIDHRNDTIKCSNVRLRLVVSLEFYDILWHHFYGLQECRTWKIVVDLLNLEAFN